MSKEAFERASKAAKELTALLKELEEKGPEVPEAAKKKLAEPS